MESLFNKVATLKEKTPIQVPSQEYCFIFKNRFFQRTRLMKTRLVIFPMSRNDTFETSYFTDPRFWQRGCDALSHSDHMEKNITKQTITNDFVFNSFSGF